MNTKERTYEILGGPNRDKLFDACKYAYDKDTELSIDFAVALGYTMSDGDPGRAFIPMQIRRIRVIDVKHEDGSGQSFIIHGYCEADLECIHGMPDFKDYRFEAYYDVRSRGGHIAFE